MDFIKKFFENIYLYFTSTITGYFAALWLTLRHPILGPQYLAHAHATKKPAIDPILFIFLTACLFMSNIFAFDLTRNDLLGPLTAGKAGPKLYMVALSALTFTIVITSVCAVLRRVVRYRHARYIWPADRKALRRTLRRRRVVRLPAENPIATRRLTALPYVLPATLVYMLAVIVAFIKVPIIVNITDFMFVAIFNFITDIWPGTLISFEFYALTDFPIPVSLSYGIVAAIWVLTLVFTPAFLPLARTLFFPMRLIAGLGLWRKLGLILGAAILSTTTFLATWTGMAAYFWLSGPKEDLGLEFSELICDLRNLPDVTAALHFDNQSKDLLIFPDDAIAIIPMKRRKIGDTGNYGIERLTGAIPMRVTGAGAQTQGSFFEIPATSQGLLNLQGYFDLQEPFDLEEEDKLICGVQISSYLVSDVELSRPQFTLEGRVLIPRDNR